MMRVLAVAAMALVAPIVLARANASVNPPATSSVARDPVSALSVPYPPLARMAHIQDTVTVAFVIKPDGSTSQVRIVGSQSFAWLDNAVVNAVRRWKFQPVESRTFSRDMRVVSFSLSHDARHTGSVIVSNNCMISLLCMMGARRPVGLHRGFYPRDAIRDREEGTVAVAFTILPDGRTTNPSVVTSSGFPLLDRAALESVTTWRYTAGPTPIRWRANLVFTVPAACEPANIVGQMESAMSGIPLCKM